MRGQPFTERLAVETGLLIARTRHRGLSLADRATISNMSPEFGATATLFPIDDETLGYLHLTGRSSERIDLAPDAATRAAILRRWYQLLMDNQDDLAAIMTEPLPGEDPLAEPGPLEVVVVRVPVAVIDHDATHPGFHETPGCLLPARRGSGFNPMDA